MDKTKREAIQSRALPVLKKAYTSTQEERIKILTFSLREVYEEIDYYREMLYALESDAKLIGNVLEKEGGYSEWI